MLVEPDDKRYVQIGSRKLGPFDRVGPFEYVPGEAALYFWVWNNDKEYFVVGDRRTPMFDAVDGIRFSPDGKRLTVFARNGFELKRYEYSRDSLPRFQKP
jgi:hypothetical protein